MDKDEIMYKLTTIFGSYVFGRELKAIHDYVKYSSEKKQMIPKTLIVERDTFGRLSDKFVQTFVRSSKFRKDYDVSNYITDIKGNEMIGIQNKKTKRIHYFRFFKDSMEFTLS